MGMRTSLLALVIGAFATLGNPAAAGELDAETRARIEEMRGEAMAKLVLLDEPRELPAAEFKAPDGAAWAPKSQTTIDAYVRRGKAVDRRPLWGPGEGIRLAKSFHTAHGQSWVEIGTNAIQSAVMNFGAKKGAFGKTKRGSSIPWGDIPARPFLGLSALDRQNIVELVEEWFEEIAARGR